MKERTRIALLFAVAVLVYGNTLVNGFTYDDYEYVLRNQAVMNLSLKGLFQPTSSSNVFRPFVFATYALDWLAHGPRPFGYHLINILLHAAVTLLLYVVLRKVLEHVPGATAIAFVSGLLFAVHPIHTEAVASITGRSELLAAGFLLAAWFLHLHDRSIPALVCLTLAMMSKESAVVFLPLAVAGDYARSKLKSLVRYAWITGVTVLYLGVLWTAQGRRFGEKSILFVDNPFVYLPASLRIPNAIRIAWKYVALQLYPATLSSDYSYNAILLYANWRHTLPAVAAALLVVGLWGWAVLTKRSAWIVAGAIYLGGFIATSNLLIPSGTIMGERLAYLPSAGFCLLIALIWMQLHSRRASLAWAVLAVILAALAARTVVRNRDWRDNFTLFSADVRAVPGSSRAHVNLGDEYMHRGQLEEARAEFQTALRIYSDFPSAIENYGLVEARLGYDQDARRLLEKALSLTGRDTQDHYFMEVNLAVQLMKLGENDEALKLLNEVLGRWAGLSIAWSNRAVIHYHRGEVTAARTDAETALHLDPANAQARSVLSALDAPVSSAPAR